MISAYEANKATREMLHQVATEFIINTVACKVREAVNEGKFELTVDITDHRDQRAAEQIVRILRDEYRFIVSFTPASSASPAWLDISWEAAEE